MTEKTSRVDETHRKELMRFLLVKTAAVRRGVKPAELLRVRHCYAGVDAEGLRVCLYRHDIYEILGLDYVELKVEESSSLVLFYNPPCLSDTLYERQNSRWLGELGYPVNGSVKELLAELVRRAAKEGMPHEVGVFIGYPLKDVDGFMRKVPSTPVHNGLWRVYGSVRESFALMRRYAREEELARSVLDAASSVAAFISGILYARAS